MKQARKISTNEVFESESLKQMKQVVRTDFQCVHCSLLVVPCSYGGHNKVEPYFTPAKKNTCHDAGCKYLSSVAAEHVSGRSLPEDAYPSVLGFSALGGVGEISEAIEVEAKSLRRLQSKREGVQSDPKYSLYDVAKYCIDFPENKDHALCVEGINGDSYGSCIEPLREPIGRQYFRLQRQDVIYRCRVSWSQPLIQDGFVIIYLLGGLWKDGKIAMPFTVRVETTKWSEKQKEIFAWKVNSFYGVVKENNNLFLEVFFIGCQGVWGVDSYEFTCDHPQKIALMLRDKMSVVRAEEEMLLVA